MRANNRLGMADSVKSACEKLCGGVSGAAVALIEIANVHSKVDPDSIVRMYGVLYSLDDYGIYEDGIHFLYAHICDKKAPAMIAVLRAVQLGFLDARVLHTAVFCGDRERARELVNVEELWRLVCDRLPNFQKSK